MLLQEFNTSNHDSINAQYRSSVPEQISGNRDFLQPHNFAEVSIKKVIPSPFKFLPGHYDPVVFVITAVVNEGFK
jgi:hypothetical protein